MTELVADLKWEVYWVEIRLGRYPQRRIVALCEDCKAAVVIAEALKSVYVVPLNWHQREGT